MGGDHPHFNGRLQVLIKAKREIDAERRKAEKDVKRSRQVLAKEMRKRGQEEAKRNVENAKRYAIDIGADKKAQKDIIKNSQTSKVGGSLSKAAIH